MKIPRSAFSFRARGGRGVGSTAGFSLLEMIIVLALMIVLAGMAALSFTSLEEGKGVEMYGNKLARMAKRASRDAVIQGRPIVIGFEKQGFGFVNETAPGNEGYCSLPKDARMGVQRWNGGKKFLPADGTTWTFFPSGICDAKRFRFEASDGAMEMGFNPLTGSVVDQAVFLNQ